MSDIPEGKEPPTVSYDKWLTTQRQAAGFRELYEGGMSLLNGDPTIYDPSQAVDLGTLLVAFLKIEKEVRDEEAAREEQNPAEVRRLVNEARKNEGD